MQPQKTENLNRDKLSLRNLLNIDFDSQFRSVSLASAARPKTMYTQRQLKVFSEDRLQLNSEKQLRRGMSQQMSRQQGMSQRLPSAEHTQDKAQKAKLKHSLGKINLLAQGAIAVDEQDRIRSIYSLLESLSRQDWTYPACTPLRTQNFYKSAFGYIYESFGEVVYIKEPPFARGRLEFLAEKTNSEMLIRLYNGSKELTYKQLSLSLFQTLDKQLIQDEQFKGQAEAALAEMQQKLTEKSALLKKLSGEIHYYQNHPAKEQYGYISELQGRLAQGELELRRAKAHVKELQNSQEYLQQYNNMLSEKVEELRAKLYQFEMQEFAGINQVEKNSELQEFERNVQVLKDLIHKGALRMASMRLQYNKIEAYNHELLGERSVLAKRAAVGFAQLTPRPNYKKIFEQQGLNVSELVPPNLKPTTQELVKSLIKCFKEFYNRYVQSGVRLEVEGRGGREQKDPANLLLAQIEKMNRQVKKTEDAAEEVRAGYSKQKEEQSKKKRK